MRLLIIFCFIFISLQGCVSPTKEVTDQALITREKQAAAYLSSGDYNAAAEEYLSLADEIKSRSSDYLLKAANAYLQGKQVNQAQTTLDKLQDDKLDPVQQAIKNIILANIALLNNDALLAINKLDFSLPDASPRDVSADYYSAKATALQMDKQYTQALYARFQLGQYIDDADLSLDNKQAIWKIFSYLTVPEIEKELGNVSSNITLAGWFDLALISKSSLYNEKELELSLESWSQHYPNHPAQGDIIQQILEQSRKINTKPKQVALLLPFGSQYRDISNAIREGFLAAWYETPGEKPLVKIYNSDNKNIVDVYKKAVNDGAEFIVGPLEKETVTNLFNSGDVSVKTLALNQINVAEKEKSTTGMENSPFPLFYQFGLLPEEEARQAAERAWSDGHVNALIITPDTTWGDRIYTAFSDRWNNLGGVIVEHVILTANIQDFSAPVKQLLNINNSEDRAKQLIATLHRKIFYEPRYRRDADVIFLALTPLVARQIVPQLRYYQADEIATYSISSIYSGNYSPEADNDINGVIFSDMPWVLDPGQEYSVLQHTLNNSWNQSESPFRRFFAFGIDAYRLIPELDRLYSQNSDFAGTTGNLKINQQGIVKRTSDWAKFVNGIPQLLDKH